MTCFLWPPTLPAAKMLLSNEKLYMGWGKILRARK